MSRHRSTLGPVLRSPGFGGLLAVRVTGQASDGVFQTALFSAVFFNPQRATSAAQAAGAFATVLLPYTLAGPFAGVFLDRWRRQRVLVHANLARAAALVAFALLLALWGPTSAPVVGVALMVVSANRFVLSGLSAALPHVVAEPLLVTANSLTTTVGTGAAALGGLLALGLRALTGAGDAAAGRISLLAGVGYLIASTLARRLGRDQLGPEHPEHRPALRSALAAVARGVRQGAAHVRQRPPAARALAAIAAHRFFYGLSFVMTLLLYTAHGALHRGLGGLGQVVTAGVVGGLLAALLTPRVTRRTGIQRWVWLVFAGASLVEAVFALPFRHVPLLIAAFFLGFAAQAAKICVDTLVQESVDDDFRGRVFSFYDTLFNLSFVAAALAAAVLLPVTGRSPGVVVLIAVGYGVTALLYALALRRRAAAEPPEPVVA